MKTFHEWLSENGEFSNVSFCEASLSRMLSLANMPFGIVSAYRRENADGSPRTRAENIQKNRELRTELNAMRMGVHQLIGHWRECQAVDEKGDKIPYDKCPQDKLVDTVERSYFVPKPQGVSQEEFQSLISRLGARFMQDAVIVSDGENVKLVFGEDSEQVIGKKAALNKIAQAYSQHILKQNVPFVFEGFQQMHGNIARQGASIVGLILPPIDERSVTIEAKLLN